MTREVFTYYEAHENSDKTKGRGQTIATYRSRDRAAVVRWAKGRGAMGTDEAVYERRGLEWDGKYYALSCNPFVYPIDLAPAEEEREREQLIEAHAAAAEVARVVTRR